MKVRQLLWLFLFCSLNLVQAQPAFVKDFNDMLVQPEYKNAQLGIHIADAATGRVLFNRNSEQLMIPASVLKMITSASALEILGADYRFRTRVGYTGTIEKGVLKGNLVIIGGGDPALGSEYFAEHYFSPHFLEVWVTAVQASGIKKVEGGLITDQSLYDDEQIPPTWIWEDMGNYYGAGTSALSVYDNLTSITFQSPAEAGMPTRILSVYPEISGLSWQNEVRSSDVNRDLAYVFGSPLDQQRIIRGTIPKNRRTFAIKASNPFPEKLLAEDFLRHLADAGIFITGPISKGITDMKDFHHIATLDSPSLSEIVKVLNHESVNHFAEQLVKHIAAEETGIGNRNAGLKIIAEFWKSRGLDIHQLFMEDGSGLSHFNAVTPEFLSSFLAYMKNSGSYFDAFYESLPAAGHGTLIGFQPHNNPPKAFRLKSGSMKRIRCYSGYVVSADEKIYTISIMINHFSGSSQKLIADLEKILIKI